jgi:hypothetical protein
MARKSTETRGLMLRLPEGLRRRLEREAEQDGRSMNAEIVYRLEASASGAMSLQALVEMLRQQTDLWQRFGMFLQESVIRDDERQRVFWEDVKNKLEKILNAIEPEGAQSHDANKPDK